MQVVLDVITNKESLVRGRSRRVWLRPGYSVCIGRTEMADHAFPEDPAMDEIHFTIRLQNGRCELKSAVENRTLVNGIPVTNSVLNNNDTIKAGATHFRIAIYGQSEPPRTATPPTTELVPIDVTPKPETEPESSAIPQSILPEPLVSTSTPPADTGLIDHCQLDSGIHVYNGPRLSGSWASVICHFSKIAQCHLIINPENISNADWQPPTDSSRLFDWLPDNVARRISPIVMRAPNTWNGLTEFDKWWGADVVTVVLSDLDTPTLVERLRLGAKGRVTLAEPTDSHAMLLSYEPSWLEDRFVTCPGEFLRNLLADVEGVFFEAHERQGWLFVSHCERSGEFFEFQSAA